jgi:bzd-type benzoyl-CoA reductase N subunit
MLRETAGAMDKVEKYFEDYGFRARELKQEGKKIIGYLCAFTPVEIITAAGFIPFRIKGNVNEPITKADTQMETIVCPLVRSCYDMTLKGQYNFLSGIIIPHACDSICRTYDIWKNTIDLPYTHMINMPHGTDDSSLSFYKDILNTFKTSLGKFAGKEISKENLDEAIQKHNANRVAVRELMELRKPQPSPISGADVTKVLVATMSLPVDESTELIKSVIAEVKHKVVTHKPALARIMVVGAQVDSAAFIKIIEDSGASVVIDDLCPGTREYWSTVDITDDPIDGIASRYLRKLKCGRTYREQKGPYPEYLEDRFGHIGKFAKEFKINGIILYFYKYCDPFGFEVPALKSYIQSQNIPVLYLEDEYSMSTIGRLKTRIQAFLEINAAK